MENRSNKLGNLISTTEVGNTKENDKQNNGKIGKR
jgi:hypothetical protein